MSGTLTVTEIFESIEGETSFAGTPMTFIRLTGCHLRCGYCDTAYAFHGGERRALDELLREARAFTTSHVCVTGGEPLAQPLSAALVAGLCDLGFTVLVETSGSLSIADVDARAITILDIKTPGSGEVERNLWSNLERLRPRDEIKIVVTSRADYEWARDLVRERRLDGARHVYVNPAWGLVDPKDLAAWILADALPVRLGLQIHKYVWGADARGR